MTAYQKPLIASWILFSVPHLMMCCGRLQPCKLNSHYRSLQTPFSHPNFSFLSPLPTETNSTTGTIIPVPKGERNTCNNKYESLLERNRKRPSDSIRSPLRLVTRPPSETKRPKVFASKILDIQQNQQELVELVQRILAIGKHFYEFEY